MKVNDLDQLEKNEQEFIMYQEAFYNILRKFYREGEKLMKKGPSPHTETLGYIDSLLFLLLWQTIKGRYDQVSVDIIRDLYIDILNGESPLGELSPLSQRDVSKNKLN